MSAIYGLGLAAPRAPTRPREGVGEFRASDRAGAGTAAAGVSATSAPGSLLGLLALQEDETGAERDRAARRHGDALLRELAALQRGLLGDEAEVMTALSRLAVLTEQAQEAADPGLAAIVRAVALRARIEVARRVPATLVP